MKANPADYDLVRPGSLAAVLALLARAPGEYTPIAGGTELMVQFAAGRLRARKLVDIFGLPELTQITFADDEITLGAGVTYTQIRQHAQLAEALPLLTQAASWTGALANQNRGTLGGNLVNGSPAADSPPALLAYRAELTLISAAGTRRIDYADFHTGYKQTMLAPDELVLAIHLPRKDYSHSYLRKVGARNAQAISKVALGAVANVVAGVVQDCRIGLASVSHSPYLCRAAEAALNGAPLTPGTIAAARAALLAEITPLDDIRSTASYRAQVSANLLEEFLAQLASAGCPMITEAEGEGYRGRNPLALEAFNIQAASAAEQALLACCGSPAWAKAVAAKRPYSTVEALLTTASAEWFALPDPDWLEAFAHHPRIGEVKRATTDFLAHSTTEQSAAQQTLAEVAPRLLEGNRAYEARFGFFYIIFASGRTAPELLGVLEQRLGNTRAEELQEAARQQDRITRFRIERWLQA